MRTHTSVQSTLHDTEMILFCVICRPESTSARHMLCYIDTYVPRPVGAASAQSIPEWTRIFAYAFSAGIYIHSIRDWKREPTTTGKNDNVRPSLHDYMARSSCTITAVRRIHHVGTPTRLTIITRAIFRLMPVIQSQSQMRIASSYVFVCIWLCLAYTMCEQINFRSYNVFFGILKRQKRISVFSPIAIGSLTCKTNAKEGSISESRATKM